MLRFNNDYNRGAHPEILEALAGNNDRDFEGYGLDVCCESGAEAIKKYLGGAEADIHFLVGGTQVNCTAIAAMLRPYQGVISAENGHINVHETGAVENTGHKILPCKGENGKLSAADVEEEAAAFIASDIKEHIVQPKMVYISQPTEFGTLYSKDELRELSRICRKYGLYLYLDGARLAYALGSPENDLSIAELAALTDIFYIGGTKCGALFGEALVIVNPELKTDFRSYIKQNGAMLAKGWLLGLQFYTLFKDGLYFEIGKRAVDYAYELKAAFAAKGIPAYMDSPTNQQFVVLTESQLRALGEKYIYEYERGLGDGKHCVRFCTSWSTRREELDALIGDISKNLFPVVSDN